MKKYLCLVLVVSGISMLHAQNPQESSNTLSGFDGISWGTSYDDAKEKFRTLSATSETAEPINIISDRPNQEIVIMRKNVKYRYVFYRKPAILLNQGKTGQEESPTVDQNEGQSSTSNPEAIARLFFVESSFPYVPSLELETKITEKYGKRNGGNLNDKTNRGYYLWNMTRGYVVQWIDPYKKKPYTRSIYYASKEIIEEIKNDYPRFQYTPELKTMMDILY